MRITDLVDRESSFKYLIGFVLAVVFLVAVALPSQSLAGFYGQLDRLSDSVRRGAFDEAEANLSEVTSFYESSRAWGMQWAADTYLFRDAFLQQASYNYLTGNYEAVVRDLADEVDDPARPICSAARSSSSRDSGIVPSPKTCPTRRACDRTSSRKCSIR